MRNAYLDTNVILSRLNPDETDYQPCLSILKGNIVNSFTSVLSIVESLSVLSRNIELIDLWEELPEIPVSLSSEEKIIATVIYLFRQSSIQIYGSLNIEPFYIRDIANTSISPEYNLAANQSTSLKLRTLDNLHLAFMQVISQTFNIDFNYFITSDKGIISKKKIVKQKTNILVIRPSELVNLEVGE